MNEKVSAKGFVVIPRIKFEDLRDKMLYLHFIEQAYFASVGYCERGQFITSMASISKESGWSYSIVRGIMGRLEKAELIQIETRSQNRGVIVTIINYSLYQSLKSYQKSGKENHNPVAGGKQGEDNEKVKEGRPLTSVTSREDTQLLEVKRKENREGAAKEKQMNDSGKRNNITAYITSLNITNSNKTLKQYLDEASDVNMNLHSITEVKIFVDFALRINAFPSNTSKEILTDYFNVIRLTRETVKISAKLLTNQIEKMSIYSANQLNYALKIHTDKHEDKREKYTLGILRNLKESEAIRGLATLNNKKDGVGNESDQSSYEEYDFEF